MRWMLRWPETLLALFVVVLEAYRWSYDQTPNLVKASWTSERKLDTRNKVRDLWYHGYDSYMRYAFPLDELSPLSCTGRGPDWEIPENIAYNDVTGNFSLTLIDSLDTLVVLNDRPGFEEAVRKVIHWVSFDVNTKPQLFETNIRVLGGLLSGHTFANQTGGVFHLPWYNGELLAMAYDLGNRLLPAFSTPTGIPFARTNLRHGVSRGESIESCTAGAGSLILEFATLSRLTSDDRFEKAAHKAFFALWNRKSEIGLVGNTINIWTGTWTHPEVSGIGAGVDSFFEYALKWYILSGEHEFLDVWNDSYAAIMTYARASDGFWYRRVNMFTGDAAYYTVDSLSAFWPGLQVLAGDVENAIKSHMMYWQIWKRHSGLPEVWDMNYKMATSTQFPLRPEFIESTWYLYRATRDPLYLDIGERIFYDILLRAKVPCGLASIRDLRDNSQEDRMESFVLSETLKYLYLLFDEANPLHTDDSNYVFTTEGHLLLLDSQHMKPMSAVVRQLRRMENHQCPVYHAPYFGDTGLPGLMVGIPSRRDADYAAQLVGSALSDRDEKYWHASGLCVVPEVDLFSYDFILSANGEAVAEDLSPSLKKIAPVADGFVINNVSGIRARIVSRLDGNGYDVSKLGPHTVHSGQLVYLNDTALVSPPATERTDGDKPRHPDVQIRFFFDFLDQNLQMQLAPEMAMEMLVTAHTALFGGSPFTAPSEREDPRRRFGHGEGVTLARDSTNAYGCAPYKYEYPNEALLVYRGQCTFLEKMQNAHKAGASGVVVMSDKDYAINPSVSDEELMTIGGTLDDVVMVVLRRSDALKVSALLDVVESQGMGQVMLAVDPEDRVAEPWVVDADQQNTKKNAAGTNRVLYLNGHPLLNTRMLV